MWSAGLGCGFLVHAPEDAAGVMEEVSPGGGELAGPVGLGSFDELLAEVGFEAGDLGGEDALGGPGSGGGSGDGGLVGDDDEASDALDGSLALEGGQEVRGTGVRVDDGVKGGVVAGAAPGSEGPDPDLVVKHPDRWLFGRPCS